MQEAQEARPLVSIVLPTHNGARYLRESVDSCLRQTHEHLELIVVNDGSTDETEEIVLSYQDPRIVYARHHPNRGLPRTLNVGFALAQGDYLTWTSDDNYYADNAIEVMLRALQETRPRAGMVYCDDYLIDAEGQVVGERRVLPPWKLWRRIPWGIGACFLYTREVYERVGDYNPEVFLAEDYEYWWRISLRFRMQPLHEKLYYYRRHSASLTDRREAEHMAAVERATASALRRAPVKARLLMAGAAIRVLPRELWIRAELRVRPRTRLRALSGRLRGGS